MAQFLYNPYNVEHGWQARVDQYIPEQEAPEHQLAWLRREWKKDGLVKQQVLSLARDYKRWGRARLQHALEGVNRRKVRWEVVKRCAPSVVLQAVEGVVGKGLV